MESLMGMYHIAAGEYKVHFSAMLPDNKICRINDVIHIPEALAYKFIFMNNCVNETTVNFAINHAINKINRFIDNYKS